MISLFSFSPRPFQNLSQQVCACWIHMVMFHGFPLFYCLFHACFQAWQPPVLSYTSLTPVLSDQYWWKSTSISTSNRLPNSLFTIYHASFLKTLSRERSNCRNPSFGYMVCLFSRTNSMASSKFR